MKRLFIGVPIKSETAVKTIKIWQKDQNLNLDQLIWGTFENWHITLFFLGNTPGTAIKLLQQLIDESFRLIQAFDSKLIGIGVFPNENHPKVLWLGFETLNPIMFAYTQLCESLRLNGYGFDNKPLKPHLTLARIKKPESRDSFEFLLNKYRHSDFGTVAINRIILYESILTPQGPIYKPLFTKWLRNDSITK